MIGLLYSTEDNSDSLRRNRWYIENTLIAVLHLKQMVPQSAMSNTHVNMAAGYQGKEMVRLEFHTIFLFSAYVISLGTLWVSFYLFSSYIAFPCIILFSVPLLPLSDKEMSYVPGFLTQSQGACCTLPNSITCRSQPYHSDSPQHLQQNLLTDCHPLSLLGFSGSPPFYKGRNWGNLPRASISLQGS